ncbi:MAG: uL15 family ribosomal protein [Patescibacteria group bacterium]
MRLHELQPIHKPKKKKRIGRGGKKGSSSGRGVQGITKSQPRIREILKRYPKLRGYRFHPRTNKTQLINLEVLERVFESGAVVNPEVCMQKRIIRRIQGKTPKVKILARGGITKALIIESCEISKSAREKIEKAGGVVK